LAEKLLFLCAFNKRLSLEPSQDGKIELGKAIEEEIQSSQLGV